MTEQKVGKLKVQVDEAAGTVTIPIEVKSVTSSLTVDIAELPIVIRQLRGVETALAAHQSKTDPFFLRGGQVLDCAAIAVVQANAGLMESVTDRIAVSFMDPYGVRSHYALRHEQAEFLSQEIQSLLRGDTGSLPKTQ